jgi:GNAT superfamily N-acetyltransferase
MIVQIGNTVRMDFAIREYQTEAELDYFLEMQFESAKENRVVDLRKPEDELKLVHRTELLKFIESKPKTGILIATNLEGDPVGYIWVADRSHRDPWDFEDFPAWIFDVRVSPAWRGQGLGRRLVLAAEQWAQRKGFERIGLHVFAFNEVAQRIYRSVGYELTHCNFKKQLVLAEASPIEAVLPLDVDRHLNALMDLWYQNFSRLARSQRNVAEDQIRARFDEYTSRVDFSNPKAHSLVFEDATGQLTGFLRIVRTTSDADAGESAWLTVFELSDAQPGMAEQLLSQGECWVTQQGLDAIQTNIYADGRLAELLRSAGYQETSLYMQKRLSDIQ